MVDYAILQHLHDRRVNHGMLEEPQGWVTALAARRQPDVRMMARRASSVLPESPACDTFAAVQ
jgi:hypothetical protein